MRNLPSEVLNCWTNVFSNEFLGQNGMYQIKLQPQICSTWIAPRFRRTLVVGVVGWVMLNFLVSSTQAGTCGHYLYRNGKPVHSESMATSQPADAAENVLAGDFRLAATEAPKAPMPCRGPGCRSGSIPLAPTPAPVSFTVSSELAVLLDELAASDCAKGCRVIPDSEFALPFSVDDIFRPPASI
jgi:hypothetical protein